MTQTHTRHHKVVHVALLQCADGQDMVAVLQQVLGTQRLAIHTARAEAVLVAIMLPLVLV